VLLQKASYLFSLLNLKPHSVGKYFSWLQILPFFLISHSLSGKKEEGVVLPGPIDIEGHVGLDGVTISDTFVFYPSLISVLI
jgi:hypothetical protein